MSRIYAYLNTENYFDLTFRNSSINFYKNKTHLSCLLLSNTQKRLSLKFCYFEILIQFTSVVFGLVTDFDCYCVCVCVSNLNSNDSDFILILSIVKILTIA